MLENPVRSRAVDHAKAAGALAFVGYDKWISLEMKGPDSLDGIRDAVEFVHKIYGRLSAAGGP
jgi:hypothetical protein